MEHERFLCCIYLSNSFHGIVHWAQDFPMADWKEYWICEARGGGYRYRETGGFGRELEHQSANDDVGKILGLGLLSVEGRADGDES